jgi:predicted dehydrogenase
MNPHQRSPQAGQLLSRRSFLKTSGGIAAAVSIVPGSVLGLNGAEPANNRLNIAAIGLGGQGARNVRELSSQNIVGLCDVDSNRCNERAAQFPNAKKFSDYRKMLEEVKGIDAVMVATPDHNHAPASMEAIQRGLHVYCEKPLTHSVWESRQLAEAARKATVATQMGNQGQASEGTRKLCETVWSGLLGNVTEAHIWTDRPSRGLHEVYWPQGMERPQDKPPVPSHLDWNLWLGPAPERPYHPAYAPFIWRGWWDFGTGALGDIGCHAMDPVFRALKLAAPLRVQASSSRVNTESYPLASMVTWHFPVRSADVQANNTFVTGATGEKAGGIAMPPCKLVWYDGGLRPPRPEQLPHGVLMGDNGRLLIGENGFLLNETFFPKNGFTGKTVEPFLPRSPGHYEEWIQACKGGKPAGSNFDWAGPLTEAVLLGNVALRSELREDLTISWLEWDSKKLSFTNMEEANRFLRREYRKIG